MAAMMASLKPPPPPAGLPAGSLPEEELSHAAMAELCAAYAAVGEDGGGEPSGMVPPMWRAANDNAVASMKSLHYYRKCAVDGFDAASRHDATMPSHVASTNGHLEALEWLATLRAFDGRPSVDWNRRDSHGHTPLWLAAAWGWERCAALLLTLPSAHPAIPDEHGVSPEAAARRVGFVAIADAVRARAEELGVQPPDDGSHVWDEPDKRWVVKPPGAADGGAGDAEDDDME